MIGKKLSPVLEEIEATLWEYEAFNGTKPNYSFEGFRAAVKIFMSAIIITLGKTFYPECDT